MMNFLMAKYHMVVFRSWTVTLQFSRQHLSFAINCRRNIFNWCRSLDTEKVGRALPYKVKIQYVHCRLNFSYSLCCCRSEQTINSFSQLKTVSTLWTCVNRNFLAWIEVKLYVEWKYQRREVKSAQFVTQPLCTACVLPYNS